MRSLFTWIARLWPKKPHKCKNKEITHTQKCHHFIQWGKSGCVCVKSWLTQFIQDHEHAFTWQVGQGRKSSVWCHDLSIRILTIKYITKYYLETQQWVFVFTPWSSNLCKFDVDETMWWFYPFVLFKWKLDSLFNDLTVLKLGWLENLLECFVDWQLGNKPVPEPVHFDLMLSFVSKQMEVHWYKGETFDFLLFRPILLLLIFELIKQRTLLWFSAAHWLGKHVSQSKFAACLFVIRRWPVCSDFLFHLMLFVVTLVMFSQPLAQHFVVPKVWVLQVLFLPSFLCASCWNEWAAKIQICGHSHHLEKVTIFLSWTVPVPAYCDLSIATTTW